MKKNSKNIDDFFGKEPTIGQKAWDIINQFYHLVLTKMEEDGISRADLARRLGKSRAAISHMFNETPNITVKKMVEIADAVELNINLTTEKFLEKKKKQDDSANEKTVNF